MQVSIEEGHSCSVSGRNNDGVLNNIDGWETPSRAELGTPQNHFQCKIVKPQVPVLYLSLKSRHH